MESFPGVKVIVIPDLDPVVAFLEGGLGRLTVKTSTHGSGQGRKNMTAFHGRQCYHNGGALRPVAPVASLA